MQQTSVTDFFKVKKRPREDPHSTNKAKLIAAISSTGKQGPSPIRKTPPSTPEKPKLDSLQPISPTKFFSPTNVRQQNIFTSPIKLNEIKSPSSKLVLSPAGRQAVKRLFNLTSSSSTSSSTATSATDADSSEPPAKKMPAYMRFHHLAQKSDTLLPPKEKSGEPTVSSLATGSTPVATQSSASPVKLPPAELHLPFKYKVLKELFNAMETVITIFFNRKEIITFEKVKASVQKLVKRVALREQHLEQMLTVLPSCYSHSYEKVKGVDGVMENQLVIGINIPGKSSEGGDPGIITPTLVLERRRAFHGNLMKMIHSHHRHFLKSLSPPIVVPSNKVVTRWHPSFKLDQVPDIARTRIPPPVNEKINTAREVILKAQSVLEHANPRMKKAIQELLKLKTKDENEKKNQQEQAGPSSTATVTQEKPKKNTKKTLAALKGVSQSLIEKIRAREQANSIQMMTLTPEESERIEMINRLPIFIKIIRNTMVEEKKSALPMDMMIERICHSLQGALSPPTVDAHIRLLSSKLPMFSNVIRGSQGEYLKIDKSLDINDLLIEFEKRNPF